MNSGLSYEEVLDKLEISDTWHHLIFARPMSSIEIRWYEEWNDVMPAVPPMWVSKLKLK